MLTSPYTYILLFAFIGMACIVAGVYVLAGIGWACITSGILLIASAAIVTRGLTANG